MFLRVLAEAFTVNPSVGKILLIPIASIGGVGLLACGVVWFARHKKAEKVLNKEGIKTKNPFELWPAIMFGLLFGLILIVSKAGQVFFGTAGIYFSSILTGLADIDPITLSLSNLAGNSISNVVAARGIVLAALANTAVKMLITCTGVPALIRYCLPIFGAMILTGAVVSFTLI